MSDIQIGDTVVCINNKANGHLLPLVRGQQYEVLDITTCKCGTVNIHVGFQVATTMCTKCKNVIEHPSTNHWFNINRFSKLDDDKSDLTLDEFMKIIEKAPKKEKLVVSE